MAVTGILKRSRLIIRVITLKLPPRILLYAMRLKLDQWRKAGNRRFEFERRYLEFPDPWNYQTSAYEKKKYDKTLEEALRRRNARGCALEIGCSIGIFTKMLAKHFDAVVAVDVSREAIKSAMEYNESETNITFVCGDIRTVKFKQQFDVIFCAEVLSYIPEMHSEIVRKTMARILSPEGILIMVTQHNRPKHTFVYFDAWEDALSPSLKILSKEIVQDPTRPYDIVVFQR
jgi:2-polyprenyl-3-methyl-5-hydroxy-6-metoxy-1,4-benzoquinol methylase